MCLLFALQVSNLKNDMAGVLQFAGASSSLALQILHNYRAVTMSVPLHPEYAVIMSR